MKRILWAAWSVFSAALAVGWMAWIKCFGRPADPMQGWKR